jgi:hypothetical protein
MSKSQRVHTDRRNIYSGGHARRRRHAGVALAATLVALALPAAALAAGLPKASTGGARDVTYNSAVLAGSVNPSGSNTSYYFQYGPTRAYGGQSAIADAGAGSSPVGVRLAISGLQPLTVYHYRLVAVNATGALTGRDNTLLTTKVPLSLQILASPNPVLFGATATVQGTLSGTGNANREVVLQANEFPFTAGFHNIGNGELTNATGSFSFSVPGLGLTTQFRVFAPIKSPIISPVTIENVAVRVSSHVARTSRRGFARVYGTVTPAANGQQVGILRIVGGRGVLVGGTVLKPNNLTSSKYSRVVPIKRGVYRVLARVTTGAQVSNYGTPLLIR